MKKIFAAGVVSVLLSTSALANDLTAKLLGRFQFEAAGVNQSGLKGEEKNVSSHKKKFGTGTNAYVGARVAAEKDGLKYGAHLSLVTATVGTGSSSYDRSHIFLESDYGKFELGSNFDVAVNMELNALTYARAMGDNASDYVMRDIKDANGNAHDKVKLFQYSYCELDGNKEGARKITYYTPKFAGLQAGISYIPDSTNFGSLTAKDNSGSNSMAKGYSGAVANTVFTDRTTMKDVWTGGLSYDYHMDDNTSMKLAFTGEYGKSAQKGVKSVGQTNVDYKMPDLKTYNVGAAFTKGAYTFVASYADFGKQGSKEVFGKDQKKNKFYTLGAVYKQGPVGASISYFKSNSHGNKIDTYVIGTDYMLAPGLMPYAEIAFFNGKGKLPAIYANDTKRKYKGAVFLLGTKLMF